MGTSKTSRRCKDTPGALRSIPVVLGSVDVTNTTARTDIIGQGAYGIVYKGKKDDTSETVAIKKIPFSDSTPEGGVPCNVIREISLLRELDHPNVVKLLDIIQAQPGGLFLVFEFVAHDLKTYMDRFQTSDDIANRVGLPIQTVRSFLRQIIAGVRCFECVFVVERTSSVLTITGSTGWMLSYLSDSAPRSQATQLADLSRWQAGQAR